MSSLTQTRFNCGVEELNKNAMEISCELLDDDYQMVFRDDKYMSISLTTAYYNYNESTLSSDFTGTLVVSVYSTIYSLMHGNPCDYTYMVCIKSDTSYLCFISDLACMGWRKFDASSLEQLAPPDSYNSLYEIMDIATSIQNTKGRIDILENSVRENCDKKDDLCNI
jgi:hypothetical protein